ncbi:type II toxin-antitoxin system PemK/MazF family toxin [Hydrogenophaga sp.]|uniref:type II toxin-antitoxin system PemK/MazF family toxin n=1 Tax=Hydrogenophaga sp. TaxID=1904254 RepID=UPI001982C8EE|nr:type II toxin-antitoxin system PemK/MazF family toxin [Hydrogenophaga sp.]MBD3894076.1 type II toxin-antitoxin system PemK/MazF family toxin [Hydrogenophaga sp.]
MRRGDLVTIAMQGDFGKPRPALVIQADQFSEHTSATVLPITSTLVSAPLLRVTIQPSVENGLQKSSQVMVDKAMTVRRDKVVPAFGRIDADALLEVERCLAVFLGIAK